MKPILNISIVTYRTEPAELARCVASLASDVVNRVYVIDNGANEGYGEEIKRFCDTYPHIEYIAGDNIGFGAAHNIALRRSLTDTDVKYHLVFNSDVAFSPDILERIVAFMEQNSEVGALQPEVQFPDGRPQYTCRLLPTPLDVFGRRFLPGWLMRRRNRRYTLEALVRRAIHNLPYHQGSFMMLRV